MEIDVTKQEDRPRKSSCTADQPNKDMCITPLNSQSSQPQMVQSIDSGFADESPLGSSAGVGPSFTSSSPLLFSSPELKDKNEGEWQKTPVYRLSKQPRSRTRRLRFTSEDDERPPSFQLLSSSPPSSPNSLEELDLFYQALTSAEHTAGQPSGRDSPNLSHCESSSSDEDELHRTFVDEHGDAASYVADSLQSEEIHSTDFMGDTTIVSVDHSLTKEALLARCRSLLGRMPSALSSLSSSTDELELSLQEMSLEESSSASAMSLCSNPNAFSRPPSTTTSVIMRPHSASPRLGQSIESALETNAQQKDYFTALALSRRVQSPSPPVDLPEAQPERDVLGYKTAAPDSREQDRASRALGDQELRVPLLPHQYFLLDGYQTDAEVTDTEDDILPSTSVSNAVKSPTKRTSVRGTDQELVLLESPSKTRRKQSSLEHRSASSFRNNESSRSKSAFLPVQESKTVSGAISSLKRPTPNTARTLQLDQQSPRYHTLGAFIEQDDSDSKAILSEPSSLNYPRLHTVLSKCSPGDPSRLIGRNIGVARLDIVTELKTRGFLTVLTSIFQHIDTVQLSNLTNVSPTWKRAMLEDHKTGARYKAWLAQAKACRRDAGKENHVRLKDKSSESSPGRQALTPSKGHLSSIQPQVVPFNLDGAAAAPQPKAPNTSTRAELLCDDLLRSCPKCRSQAKMGTGRAVCLSEKCAFDFCPLCFAAFHHSKPCKPLCRNNRNQLAGTRRSKKNLKRL